MNHFKFYNKQDILSLTKIRRFETKLGELIDHVTDSRRWQHEIESTAADYIIFGIPEDIGVLANNGVGGAHTAWVPFLESFLNIQSNDFLEGIEMLLLGHFDFDEVKELVAKNSPNEEERIIAYRHAVQIVDEAVSDLVKVITALGKIPIAVGGGHNNAYGMIKGAAKGLHKTGALPIAQINAINLDAHTDYRPTEGRHSGNAFRYAIEDGFLNKYCVIGIHENYIPQNVWIDIVNNPFMDCITYEDVFIHEKYNFIQAIAHATSSTEETYTGVELDLDSIENTLSSAATPCGIQPLHARQYLTFAARDCKIAYVHICEGAAQSTDGRHSASTGKLISYLVSDFVKTHCEMLEG
jgi:formiminoglutamase